MLKIETVFIYSLLHPAYSSAMWLRASGRLLVARSVFFPPVAELKEEIVLLTSQPCFLSLATQMNYFPMLVSENEFDRLIQFSVHSPLYLYILSKLCAISGNFEILVLLMTILSKFVSL